MNPFDLIPHVRIIFVRKMLRVLKGIGVHDFPDVGAGNGEVIAVQAREKLDSVPNMP